MKVQKRGLLFIACIGMELSWLYALASFIMTSIVHRSFPFIEPVGTFVLAAMLTLFAQGRGWRVFVIIALQIFGFMLAASRIVHVFFYAAHPFFAQWWLMESLGREKNFLEWFILIMILLLALMFWVGGLTLARRSSDYRALCIRFDWGVAVFFCILLIKFILFARGGITIQDPASDLLLFPFFLFSLLSIGMARNRSSVQKDFLSGYRGIGVALSFGVVVVAFGGGLVGLFLPYLSKAAEMGYGVLKDTTAPLSPILVAILRFIFAHNRGRSGSTSSSSGRDETEFLPPPESSWWTDLLAKIFGWGFLGLGLLILLFLCSLGMWYLLRWLLSRHTTDDKTPIQWRLILLWAGRIWSYLVRCRNAIARRMRGYKSAVQLYGALLKWGGHSGLPHAPSETPTEYGMRLGRHFPFAGGDIGLITELCNKEVYGRMGIDEQEFTMAKLAWRRLYNPIHWPTRFKSWFLRSGA